MVICGFRGDRAALNTGGGKKGGLAGVFSVGWLADLGCPAKAPLLTLTGREVDFMGVCFMGPPAHLS